MSEALRRSLARIVGDANVLTRDVDRLAYREDCWPRGLILTRGRQLEAVAPAAIAQPCDEGQVVALVRWARQAQVPIVPFGAGSGVCGGARPDDDTVVIDLKRMQRALPVSADGLLRAQAGALGMTLERELLRQGYTLGHYPSSLLCSTLGGYLAARSAGQHSSRYGKIEDMVVSARLVSGAGEAFETAPDPLATRPRAMAPSHAHDLTQLVVGSEGTLGVITAATLRVHPRSSWRAYRGFRFHSVDDALDALRALMQAGLRPSVVRLYDTFDTMLAKPRGGVPSANAPTPGLLARVTDWLGQGVGRSALGDEVQERAQQLAMGLMARALGQPLWLNRAIDALPEDCLAIIGFDGDGPLWEQAAAHGFSLLRRKGEDLGEEPGERWLAHRYDVSYKQSALYVAGAFVDTFEVSAPWARLRPVYDAVRRALAPHALVMAHFSHAYSQGCSIYFTFCGYGADLDETLQRYDAAWRDALSAASAADASIAHHHGVGLSRAAWTARDHIGGAPLFAGLKAALDPDGIMNPGKVYAEVR